MTHRFAVALMILATLLWSIAGVVIRHLDTTQGFELTFWRSLSNAVCMLIALRIMRGSTLWHKLWHAPWKVWVSGICWGIMYTGFMLALALTTVANVLVVQSVGPLITALFARVFLRYRLPLRTWGAIVVASAGIAWMFGQEAAGSASLIGTLIALGVPFAASTNWTLLQSVSYKEKGERPRERPDMLLSILIGALLSTCVTLPLCYPFQASTYDISWLAILGVVQLAAPCLLAIRASRGLHAAEMSLLLQLETLFGVTWAWLGAGEQPPSSALIGGALVLGALVTNEILGMRENRRTLDKTQPSLEKRETG